MLVDGPDCLLNVEIIGTGTPVTVIAHGITSSIEEIRYLAARTSGTRVLFDFRGHGHSESPEPDRGFGHQAMRRDLEQVAARFGATRAVGVSMGAGAILSMLEDDPSRFDRVVLLIPARLDSSNGTTDTYPALADALQTQPLAEVAASSLNAAEYQPLFEARPQWRHLVEQRILRMNATGIPAALRVYANEGGPVGDIERLRKVEAPVLILAHEGDGVHHIDVARRLAGLLPNATLRTWPEPLAMFDDPIALSEIVGKFLTAPVV
jgi:pimeloyl-ACP methyl ester carboxylesterase